ncbi:hypothetical protein LSAT2_017570 [Lamellibrachia satsuma]|nr:hypothetical protein LSAT2_017570 [Lamellibrachia satsuma]
MLPADPLGRSGPTLDIVVDQATAYQIPISTVCEHEQQQWSIVGPEAIATLADALDMTVAGRPQQQQWCWPAVLASNTIVGPEAGTT